MPTYDYKCTEHGYFEQHRPIKFHKHADCPTCGNYVPQVIRTAPGLDVEAMADVGMPGAMEKRGDRMTRRHIDAGQDYVHPDKR